MFINRCSLLYLSLTEHHRERPIICRFMKITFFGHSAVKIEGKKTLYIDPFFRNNPITEISPDQIEAADIVVATHDHADHIGDSYEICKKTNALFVGIHEIAVEAEEIGVRSAGMNIGGTINIEDVLIHMVQAIHSSTKSDAAGVVIETEGVTMYHAGDTGLFGDMRLIGEFFDIDLAFLPIGDRYTMGTKSAVKAVEFLRPKRVIPIHYNTFPIIKTDPNDFKELVGNLAEVIILSPGESLDL
ncbi:MAG: metal-dependent hydrolase [Candidatus Scalindua sp.]|nr:metal-dependent hydrolase [Candidatus Scalindua sp.]